MMNSKTKEKSLPNFQIAKPKDTKKNLNIFAISCEKQYNMRVRQNRPFGKKKNDFSINKGSFIFGIKYLVLLCLFHQTRLLKVVS